VLRAELEIPINERMTDTRRALLENFDEDVHLRLRTSYNESSAYLSNLERSLWELTKFELTESGDELASFDEDKFEFNLLRSPVDLYGTQTGVYRFVTRKQDVDGTHPYRLGDSLAEHLISKAKRRDLLPAEIRFDYSNHSGKIGLIEPYVGESGWLKVSRLKITALEEEDHLLYAVITDSGEHLHPEFGEKLFRLAGKVVKNIPESDVFEIELGKQLQILEESTITEISNRNGQYFDEEIDKLDRWADDLKHGLEMEIKDLDIQIRTLKKDSRLAGNLQAKIEMHRQLKDAESERSAKRRKLYEAQDQIDEQKEDLISSVEAKLQQKTSSETLFTIRWQVR